MNKYRAVFAITLTNILQYRLNFAIGRARNLITLITLFFLWNAVFASQEGSLFGYSREQMFGYVILTHMMRSVVLLTTTANIAGEIAPGGKLFSYLLRPVDYVYYWFTVDLGYKLVDTLLAFLELMVFLALFKISFFFPVQPETWLLFTAVVIFAIVLNFLMGYAVSLVAFWTNQVWSPRFLYETTLAFAAGSFFPLDVLPTWLQQLLYLTPFPYLLFFPANVLLGRIDDAALIQGLAVMFAWIGVFVVVSRVIWQKGLRMYEGGTI